MSAVVSSTAPESLSLSQLLHSSGTQSVQSLVTEPASVIAQKLPVSVVDALIGSLATVEGQARLHVEDCLVRYGSRTLPSVLDGLKHDSPLVQSRCAFVVVRMGVMALPAYRQWRGQQTSDSINQPLLTLIEEQLGLV